MDEATEAQAEAKSEAEAAVKGTPVEATNGAADSKQGEEVSTASPVKFSVVWLDALFAISPFCSLVFC